MQSAAANAIANINYHQAQLQVIKRVYPQIKDNK